MTCSILVCDDEPDVAKDWLAAIEGVLPESVYALLPVPSNEEIRSAIQVLLRRRAALRDGQATPDEACLFDTADVLVLDYDLLHVDETNTRYTGEGLARLARVFSTCGPILVLNQYLEAQFDLSLRGHMESFADLNIDADVIARPGLWHGSPWEGFRPWHWPVLAKAAEDFKSRAAFLSQENRLGSSMVDVLGMNAENAGRLSDTAFGFLAPEATTYEGLAKSTFANFIASNSAAVDTGDGEKLVGQDPEAAARIAASRLAKWLEREVLGPQDVLADVPHLLQRLPFLFAGDLSDLDAWNAAVAGGPEQFKEILPKDAWFGADGWLSRPAVWWRAVERSDAVRDARAKFDYSSSPDFVFLEDVSRFAPLAEATEFRAGFHNQFDRRFVSRIGDIRYAPQRRFAFGG